MTSSNPRLCVPASITASGINWLLTGTRAVSIFCCLRSRSLIPSLVNYKVAPIIVNQVAPILSSHKVTSSTRSHYKRTPQGFTPFCGLPIVLPTAYHVVRWIIVWPCLEVKGCVGVCRCLSRRRRKRRGKSFVSICPREDSGMLAGLGRREVPSLHRFGRQGEDGVISSNGLRRYRGLRLFGCCSQRVTGGCTGLFGGSALRWKRQPLFPLTCPFLVHVRRSSQRTILAWMRWNSPSLCTSSSA